MVFPFLFGVYWLLISFLGFSTMINSFKKYQNYHKIQEKPEWEGLLRLDARSWNRKKIILGCFLYAPLKILVLAVYLAFFFIIAIAIYLRGKFTPFFQKLLKLYVQLYAPIMKILLIDIKEQFTDYNITTPIIICNHVNWFDIFYCNLRFLPLSYISKSQVAKYPIVGILAKTINCIFIDRESQSNRQQSIIKIKQRINDFNNKQETAFPLAIYPQGTTSNGRGILKFKMGAFQNLSPITMICLHYQCEDCGLGQDEVTQLEHLFLLITQSPKLTVKKIVIEPKEDETGEQYMNRAKQTMANTLGYINSNAGYRNKVELQKLRQQEYQGKKHQ